MLEETDSISQVTKQGRLQAGRRVGGRYYPSFVLPARHPFGWRSNPGLGTNAGLGGVTVAPQAPGGLSLSQLGCH